MSPNRRSTPTSTAHDLGDDDVVLASTPPHAGDHGAHIRDPGFVYADNGEEFRGQYAAKFPDTANPIITFGRATWARDHLRLQGGAAYLPRRPLGGEDSLSVIEGAPVFRRPASPVVNNRAAAGWPWLADMLSDVKIGCL